MGNKTTQVLIDWLSISGVSSGVYCTKTKLVKLDFGTSVFAQIEELYYKNERIATVTSKPHSSVLKSDLMIVKFDNWTLYSNDFYNIFELVIYETGLKDYKISRIDIAKDFNTFYYNLLPNTLIKNFLSGKFLKLGKSKYSVWGETNRFLTYDYLSFGRKASPVNSYLYNKSTELKQVKYKPHIVQQWVNNGLNVQKDVFRLEFSIKLPDIKLINVNTGETLNFNIDFIFVQEYLENLYLWMMSKFFRIKKNTNQKNISREPDVTLFKYQEFDSIIWEPIKRVETNRADKIFLRKLDTLFSEFRVDNKKLFDAIEVVRDNFAEIKNLKDYLEKNIIPQTEQKMKHPSYYKPELKEQSLADKL